jgi:M6 family metalloprotease-like protein
VNKKLIAFLSVFSLFLTLPLIPVNAAAKAGGACSKAGLTSVASSKTYTCIKSGKKLVWDKGVSSASDSNKAISFSKFCDPDPLVPAEWKSLQEWGVKYGSCITQWRYVPGPTNFVTPSQALTEKSLLKPIDSCKLTNTGNTGYALRGFPLNQNFTPTKRANIQVLAVSFKDAPDLNNPITEHLKEITYFTDTLKNASDVPINPVVRNVDKYIQLPKDVEDYKLYVHQPNTKLFAEDVIKAWDAEINFSDVDYILIFAPDTLFIQQFNRAINFQNFRTAEKTIQAVMVAGPLLSDGTNRNSQYEGNTQNQWLQSMPAALIHEGIYHMVGLDDHLGNESYLNPRSPNPSNWDELGTGLWGNMSAMNGELLTWDKWTVGFIADSQVRCTSSESTSTHWLRPSSSKGDFEKLIVVPLSTTKAIVVESRRSTGYNYKYPTSSEGALVYIVDTTDSRHSYGVYVKRPLNRPDNRFGNGFSLGDAALKKGESITLSNVKISIIDSGSFGDVVKVEKVV